LTEELSVSKRRESVFLQLRSDIEGLRGLAVLAVVVQHAFPGVLPGGFLGVDIFFVISGYVIGHGLILAAQKHQLSVADFYRRRIRRIFPSLVLVCAAVLVSGWFLLSPREFARLGIHAGAASLFGNNILLWHEVGYFDASASSKPLLHLWSLGVEEQFYLVLPVLLWPLRKSLHAFVGWMVVAVVASFAFWVLASSTAPSTAFYLLPFRWWELGSGIVLAGVHLGVHAIPERFGLLSVAKSLTSKLADERVGRNVAMVALGALAISLIRLDESHWPGAFGAIPVAATALLLRLGSKRKLPVLSNKALAVVGGISYPLYLWHWPALVYCRMVYPESAPFWLLVPIGGAFVLAILTKELVERPIRFGHLRGIAWLPTALVGVLLTVGAFGWTGYALHGFPSRFGTEVWAGDASAEARAAWREGRCFFYMTPEAGFAPECEAAGIGGRHVFLWGDSHAAHLYPGLVAALPADKYRISQFTAASCPPVFDPLRRGASLDCSRLRELALDAIRRQPPDVVVLAGAWRTHADTGNTGEEIARAIIGSVKRLKDLGVREVVVVGPGPSWSGGLPAALFRSGRPGLAAAARFDGADATLRELDSRLSTELGAAGIQYFSLVRLMCDAGGCVVRNTEGPTTDLFYFDEAHLTVTGSVFVGRALAAALARDESLP
jgi:peptidoglycan/LPS O-acetylase OafA/YrhL